MGIYKDPLFQKHSITISKLLSFVVDLSDLNHNSLLGNKCAIITGSVTVKIGGLSANGTRYAEIFPMDNAESSVQRHLELLDLFTRPEKENSNGRLIVPTLVMKVGISGVVQSLKN